MEKQKFIELIAGYAKKHTEKYGISVISPIVAQACLESAFGTSKKAMYHNYFGLKYREGRVTCHSGTFTDGSAEQRSDGSYIQITDQWYKFATPENGVIGYLQFINTKNYAALKGETDPLKYLEKIKAAGYATSIDYVKNVMAVIDQYDLTRYDDKETEKGAGMSINKTYAQIRYNTNYLAGRKIEYIVIHNTATEASAENNCKYFSGGDRGSSADFFVDRDGSVFQFNADIENNYSWHCGDGGGRYGITNANSVGIECISAGTEFTQAQKDALRDLISHIKKEYGASQIVRHYDASRKICPMAYSGSTANDAKWKSLVEYVAKEPTIAEAPQTSQTIKNEEKAVYRLYNPNSGEHFFTMSVSERDSLLRSGWKYEGIAWYSAK